ncbi:branched-chain amino acid ABC transporter permease [Chloroflexota bacterium]
MNRGIIAKGIGLLVLIVVFFVPSFIDDLYYIHTLIMVMYYIILALSLRLIMKLGDVSFAHAAFAAIGAYGSALFVIELDLPFWAAFPLAGIVAALIAVVVGFPSLRLRGAYFFLVTFAFGQIIVIVLGGYWEDIFGGYTGLVGIPGPDPIGPWEFISKTPYYYFILSLALITGFIMWRIDRSRIGLILRSIAERDVLAHSLGINIMKYRMLAFITGCFFAGLAGSFYAHYVHIVSPESFSFLKSIQIVAFCVVGGTASIAGPIIGVCALTALSEIVQEQGPYEFIVYGIALVVVFLFLPDGLLGLPKRVSGIAEKLSSVRSSMRSGA